MKRLLKTLAAVPYTHYLHRPPHYLFKRVDEILAANQAQQIPLRMRYEDLVHEKRRLSPFDDLEFSVYAQAGEDGILWYIFSLVGTTNKVVVEIGAGNGIENNSANLIVNNGWKGFLFDASRSRVRTAKEFYGAIRQTRIWPPTIQHAWVEPTNVNEILSQGGVVGPVDLLSLDIDGIDYWVSEARAVIDPRVVVVEFNNLWNADDCLTVPKDPNFRAEHNSRHGADYSGATLGAFVKLGARKGYRLVGCQRYGFNAFQ